MEAVDARMKESQTKIDEAVERRKVEREIIRQQEAEKEETSERIKLEVEKTVEKWKLLPSKREAGIVDMLNTLDSILPNCVPQGFSSLDVRKATLSEVKKVYMKAVRLIHPDKLSVDLDLESKILAERVFVCVTETFDRYRKAHDV
jgi:uncharacterized protein Yka (UPF0111/DUF47 family)